MWRLINTQASNRSIKFSVFQVNSYLNSSFFSLFSANNCLEDAQPAVAEEAAAGGANNPPKPEKPIKFIIIDLNSAPKLRENEQYSYRWDHKSNIVVLDTAKEYTLFELVRAAKRYSADGKHPRALYGALNNPVTDEDSSGRPAPDQIIELFDDIQVNT